MSSKYPIHNELGNNSCKGTQCRSGKHHIPFMFALRQFLASFVGCLVGLLLCRLLKIT